MRDGTQFFAPGVRTYSMLWKDVFVGTRESLLAAGVVRAGQFPGDGDNGPVRVSYFADGTRVPRGPSKAWAQAGHLRVCRSGKTEFIVERGVGAEGAAARLAERANIGRHWPFPFHAGAMP